MRHGFPIKITRDIHIHMHKCIKSFIPSQPLSHINRNSNDLVNHVTMTIDLNDNDSYNFYEKFLT